MFGGSARMSRAERVSADLGRRILEERDPITVVIPDDQAHRSIACGIPRRRKSVSLESPREAIEVIRGECQ